MAMAAPLSLALVAELVVQDVRLHLGLRVKMSNLFNTNFQQKSFKNFFTKNCSTLIDTINRRSIYNTHTLYLIEIDPRTIDGVANRSSAATPLSVQAGNELETEMAMR